MTFKQISDVTPLAIRKFRQSTGMSQKDFWGAMDLSVGKGCRYETGVTALPNHIRRLVFLQYGQVENKDQALMLVEQGVDLMQKGLDSLKKPSGNQDSEAAQ